MYISRIYYEMEKAYVKYALFTQKRDENVYIHIHIHKYICTYIQNTCLPMFSDMKGAAAKSEDVSTGDRARVPNTEPRPPRERSVCQMRLWSHEDISHITKRN